MTSSYICNLFDKIVTVEHEELPLRLDVSWQVYTITGLNSPDMTDLRRYIMSTKIPGINTSICKRNTSNYESMSISFPCSNIPIKIRAEKLEYSKICNIQLRLHAINNGESAIEISTSTTYTDENGIEIPHFYITNDSGYDISVEEDYYITSLDPNCEIDIEFLMSDRSLYYCSNFIFEQIGPLTFKVYMRSVSYTLIDILRMKELIL